MKKLFSWMFKPAGLTLLNVFLLSLVIWFEAPLLTFDGKVPFGSTSVRWFFILLLLAIWAAYFGWKIIKAPGPWKPAYKDGKVFPVGWYRGNLEFAPSLVGLRSRAHLGAKVGDHLLLDRLGRFGYGAARGGGAGHGAGPSAG